MAYKYIEAEINMRDFSNDDLIEELAGRPLDDWDKKSLLKILNEEDEKICLFIAIKHRYSLFELEKLFNESSGVGKIPKEQLGLFQENNSNQ